MNCCYGVTSKGTAFSTFPKEFYVVTKPEVKRGRVIWESTTFFTEVGTEFLKRFVISCSGGWLDSQIA